MVTCAESSSESDSKSDPKSDPKLDPKSESKLDPKSDPRLDPKSDPNSDSKLDPNSDSKLDPNSDSKLDPKSDSKLDPISDPKLDPNSDPKLDPNSDPKLDPKSDSKSDPKSEKESKFLEYKESLRDGKRAFALGDLQVAADLLSTAAQLSVEVFGELEKEVYEPHLYYGKVLLELERIQKANLITEAIGAEGSGNQGSDDDGVSADEARGASSGDGKVNGGRAPLANKEEQKSEVKNDEPAEDKGNGNVSGKKEELKEEKKEEEVKVECSEDEKCVEKKSSSKESQQTESQKCNGAVDAITETSNTTGECSTLTNKDTKSNSNGIVTDTAAKVTDDDDNFSDDDYDDPGPLQLAWEVLEVARTVCDRTIQEDEWKEKKVEALLMLAQCSLEGENYGQAVGDLNDCIKLGEAVFKPHDRRLAEAHYQAGQACCLSGRFKEAKNYFTNAKHVLSLKCDDLKKNIETCDDKRKERLKRELRELTALMPEINLKIQDCRESAEAEKLRKIAMEKVAADLAGKKPSTNCASSGDKVTDDITMLVRKKGQKRSGEEAVMDEAKRSKVDVVVGEENKS